MRSVLVAFAVMVWPLAAWAQASSGAAAPGSADAAAIRGAIERQLDAFRRDDAAAAFAITSPGIQEKFGAPDQFMDMVKSGYRPVYRPREIEFRALDFTEDGPVQKVLFVGPDGRPVLALYRMERQADGSWRIGGCVLVEPDDRTS